MGSLLLPVTASQLFNMKSMILIAVFLAVAAAAPPGQPSHPHRQAIAEPRHGETSVLVQLRDRERIVVSESGVQKQIGAKPEESGTVSQGSYSFPEDSQRYTVTWVADENGFQAKG